MKVRTQMNRKSAQKIGSKGIENESKYKMGSEDING
jgi:hypothetical protein